MQKQFKLLLFTMLILVVGCSKSQKEIFEDAIHNIDIYSQELFDYIDKDSNKKITKDEFVIYKKKQDEFYKKNISEEERALYYSNNKLYKDRSKTFDNLFKKADRDKSGFLDFDEFRLRFSSYNRQEFVHVYLKSKSFFYRTQEQNITVAEIQKKSNLFKRFNSNLSINRENRNETIWVRIKLPKELKTGIYRLKIPSIKLDNSSFTKAQNLTEGRDYLQFSYDRKRDKREYYFRVASMDIYVSAMLFKKNKELSVSQEIQEAKYNIATMNCYQNPEIVLLFSGIGIGLIFMAFIYTLAIFYNYRKREFLYYSLLQLGMVALLYMLINQHYFILPYISNFMRECIGLFIALFATLFTQSFLETKKYLPKMHLLFNTYRILILIDALWYADALLETNHLYSVFGVLFLIAGVIRVIQGYKIAWFYIIGWFFLILATFLMEYYYQSVPFYTFFLGAGMEAMMLAWGLTYKMKKYEKS